MNRVFVADGAAVDVTWLQSLRKSTLPVILCGDVQATTVSSAFQLALAPGPKMAKSALMPSRQGSLWDVNQPRLRTAIAW